MDPKTVIIVLAMHLGCMGGLFLLIGRRMPPHSGLRAFGVGAIVFSLAYALRLAAGLQAATPLSAVLDSAMVLAALLFVRGLRQFVGRREPGRQAMLAMLALYLLLHAVAVSTHGAQGRYVLLNVTLGLVYMMMAVAAQRELPQQDAVLRMPLRVLVVLTGLLGLLTLARGTVIAVVGTEYLYQGLAAQVYYAYASLAAVLLAPNLLWMVYVQLNRQLSDLATHDALTRLLNRHGLDDVLRRHFGDRSSVPVTLLLVDIDHFKRINDSHGHSAGDAVLRTVAAALQDRVRAGDFVARTGGEEFLVGCVGGSAALAQDLAERLRIAVAQAETPLPDGRTRLRCTVSVGVSRPFAELQAWEHAAREADTALYAAKQAGRDRVAVTP
jgi:diguanylate cyclase (GGDEF)-like protein